MPINYHHNRRSKNFLVRKVKDALPEFYTSDFPKLVTFLENYYEFLDDSIGASSFDDDIRQLFSQRDVHAASTTSLNSIISEITGGLPNGDNFTDPSFYATRLAELARNKGTRFSIEETFREDVICSPLNRKKLIFALNTATEKAAFLLAINPEALLGTAVVAEPIT